jgi:multidrug resistance efflux pump
LLPVVLLLIGGLAAYQLWLKPKPQAAVVTRIPTVKAVAGTLERTIRISGQTSARNFANIIAPLLRGPESRNSLVLLTTAKPGSRVKKGDFLAQIDGQSAQDHIDDVQDMVKQAKSDVDRRAAQQAVEWENLQQTVRVAKAEFDKAKLEAGAAEVRTVLDQELLKLAVDEYQARYKQVQADLEPKKQAHKAELRILGITSERQDRHLERHEIDIKKYTIKTPIDGLVAMESVWRGGEMGQIQAGDQVFPGQRIMKVVDTGSMQVEATISQAESQDFRIGQPATVTLDAFPGLELKGRVYSIAALAVGTSWRANNFIRSIPVRIEILGSDPRLIPDLSAAADVVVERSEPNSTLIPLAAVRREGGRDIVHVKKADGFERREVKLGMKNHTHAAVLAGVSAGEEIRAAF